MKQVTIIGAGVVGVTTAWYLNQAGFAVTVVERQPAAGLETSYANGGQISVSHAEPWANPSAPKQLVKWLTQPDAPLRFRPTLDVRQYRWGLEFLRQCSPANTERNIAQLVNLGLYSRAALKLLNDTLKLTYQRKRQGILHFYTEQASFSSAQQAAKLMRQFGCERQILSPSEAIATEPALASIDSLVGATFTADDESGNAVEFTQGLAEQCAKNGVRFLYDTAVTGIYKNSSGNSISHINITQNTHHDTLPVDALVLCAGSYSPRLAAPLGVELLIYPAKGYSATFQVTDVSKVPQVSLTDDEQKLVFSRFSGGTQDVLRVAGMAEVGGAHGGFDTELNMARATLITKRVLTLFPQGLNDQDITYWTGLRPSTPSNVPYIGKSNIANLWLNTGHGTLGWTHACGSAKALALLMQGEQPEVDFAFC